MEWSCKAGLGTGMAAATLTLQSCTPFPTVPKGGMLRISTVRHQPAHTQLVSLPSSFACSQERTLIYFIYVSFISQQLCWGRLQEIPRG